MYDKVKTNIKRGKAHVNNDKKKVIKLKGH